MFCWSTHSLPQYAAVLSLIFLMVHSTGLGRVHLLASNLFLFSTEKGAETVCCPPLRDIACLPWIASLIVLAFGGSKNSGSCVPCHTFFLKSMYTCHMFCRFSYLFPMTCPIIDNGSIVDFPLLEAIIWRLFFICIWCIVIFLFPSNVKNDYSSV